MDKLYAIYKNGELFRSLGGQLAYSSHKSAIEEVKKYAGMYARTEYEHDNDRSWYDLKDAVKEAVYEEMLASFEIVEYIPVG